MARAHRDYVSTRMTDDRGHKEVSLLTPGGRGARSDHPLCLARLL